MKSVLQSVKKGKAAVKEAMQAVNLPPPVQIAGKQLTFQKKIGEGGFAIVYLCKDEAENPYALKKCLVQTAEQMKCMTSELELLKALKHPHIINVVGAEKRNMGVHTEFYILMEYAEKSLLGMMQERHQENRRFSEKEVLRIFNDVVSAVAHCHSQTPPVAHRDLKIENVLLGQDKLFKLCDFGSCIRTAYEPQNYRECSAAEEEIDRNTTLCYRAPEMCDLLSKKRIDEKCDVWALGCLLYYLCFFELPFEEQKLQIINGKYIIPSDHSYRPEIIELIRACLTVDPADRPDIWTVAEQLSILRGVVNKVIRPDNYVPQPVSIGGNPAAASVTTAPKPSPKPTIATAPKPQAARPAAQAGGALFSQLDWQASDGTVVKPAPTNVSPPSSSPIKTPFQKESPTEAPKPKADFAMPDFDDLSISPPKPASPAVASPAFASPAVTTPFDPFPLDQPKAQGANISAGMDDFDFNPRGLPASPTQTLSAAGSIDPFAMFSTPSDEFNPRAAEVVPTVSVSPAPKSPAVPAKDDLFANNGTLFGNSATSAKPSTPTTPLKDAKSIGSVDAMASKLLEGFLTSSGTEASPRSPKPTYTPMSNTTSLKGVQGHQRSASTEQTNKDPFASLF